MSLQELRDQTHTFKSVTSCATAATISSGVIDVGEDDWNTTSQGGPVQTPLDAKAATDKALEEGVFSSKNCETENIDQQIRRTWHREVWENRCMVEVRADTYLHHV